MGFFPFVGAAVGHCDLNNSCADCSGTKICAFVPQLCISLVLWGGDVEQEV